jgi:hypothetical protein
MPEQQQQQQQPAVAMPQVSTNLLTGDDYVYEPTPPPEKPFTDEGLAPSSGGMAIQFSDVSSALNKNI